MLWDTRGSRNTPFHAIYQLRNIESRVSNSDEILVLNTFLPTFRNLLRDICFTINPHNCPPFLNWDCEILARRIAASSTQTFCNDYSNINELYVKNVLQEETKRFLRTFFNVNVGDILESDYKFTLPMEDIPVVDTRFISQIGNQLMFAHFMDRNNHHKYVFDLAMFTSFHSYFTDNLDNMNNRNCNWLNQCKIEFSELVSKLPDNRAPFWIHTRNECNSRATIIIHH